MKFLSPTRIDLIDLSIASRSPLVEASTYVTDGAETHHIVLRETTTGAETSIGEFSKSNAGDYTWTLNPELCGRNNE
jgi:hypothetical protein